MGQFAVDIGDNKLQCEPFGPGADNGQHLWMDRVIDQKALRRRLGRAPAYGHRFGRSSRFIEQ